MGFEIMHEWEPNDKVKDWLKLDPVDHIVVGYDGRTGQRVRGIRRDGKIVDMFNVLVDARNLYYRCVDAGACAAGLHWLKNFEPRVHVDDVFEKTPHIQFLTWWFDRFYPKTDEASQRAYFDACAAYEKARREIWSTAHLDPQGASIKFADAFDDWKDAVKDFYLPALRAWVITYDPDRPYIRV